MRSVLLLALGACGFTLTGGTATDAGDGHAGSDASDGMPDVPIDVPPDMPFTGWAPAQPLGITNADDPTLTGDMLEIWYERAGDIYYSSRASLAAPWSTGERIAELSTTDLDTTPEVSYDGLTMTAARLVGNYDLRIWRRASGELWGNAASLGDLNGPTHDAAAVLSGDRLTIAFTSWRVSTTSADIFTSTRASTADGWATPVLEATLSSPAQDGSTFLSADALTMCFDSSRNGTLDLDLYCATRASAAAAWDTPAPIAELNTTDNDEDPWLAPDGKTIVFFSNRGGLQQLWYSTRP